ncbi:hypothetical protein RHMOL_Rhmol03G0065300 [Rhododendron molle]|uniref:Uncharacterized protein n=1 Tax=Rhododendron molle TaxID=49168 RepID=A0ACC0PBD3_RHOML|nr:hypothetical protein RHMOL_Rhmol03G0065300 [Rhododendron molle]
MLLNILTTSSSLVQALNSIFFARNSFTSSTVATSSIINYLQNMLTEFIHAPSTTRNKQLRDNRLDSLDRLELLLPMMIWTY